jgi:adenylate cyclase
MPKIYCKPDNTVIEASKNETILEAALRQDISLSHICGGNGRCSTCRVLVEDAHEKVSKRTPEEKEVATKMDFGPEIRLACQTRAQKDVNIRRLVLDDVDIELTSLFIEQAAAGTSGVEKHVFILFADIRGFTSLAETLLPYDVIHILNRYFHTMGEVITGHGGSIDNYLGDGFMALFEGDDPQETAIKAIQAGVDMLKVVEKNIRPYVQQLWNKDFEIGIGLHYGLVVAGTVGTLARKRETVIGDAVNFASRIESANKIENPHFLISKDVYKLVSDKLEVNRTVRVNLPGKAGEHELIEVKALNEL